jgi:drug/metabolite transporter (DMT)-like permease
MVFVNKLILRAGAKSGRITPDSLLIVQCGASTLILFIGCILFQYPVFLSLSNLTVCAVVNFAFVATMLANSYSLRYLSIQMVTLLKCCSVVVTALGDRIFYGHQLNPLTWTAIGLIVIGSVIGLITDLEFSALGYFWMVLSIGFASLYVLLTKLLVSYRDIPFFTTVLWNNFLGTVFVLIYSFFLSGFRAETVYSTLTLVFSRDSPSICTTPVFILFSGVVGLLLNVSTFSLLGETSATSYVVVGAGKKIFQALLSYMFFDVNPSIINVTSVMIGLSGATLYAYVKWSEQVTKIEIVVIAGDSRTNQTMEGTVERAELLGEARVFPEALPL